MIERGLSVDDPRSLVGLTCLFVMAPMFFLLMPLYIGVLVDYRGFDNSQAGLVTSLELLGYAAAAIVAVFWVRRVSWRRAGLCVANS